MNNITRKLPLGFFEKIELHPLDNKAGRFNVQSNKHFIFSMEHNFRGIKKALKTKDYPFFFTHQESFETACAIFKELYKKDPTTVYYFHNTDKTWNGFVVSNDDLNENSYLFPSAEAKYNPLIGAFNGYGMDENPAFFMLISSPFDSNNSSFLTIDNFRFLYDVDKISLFKVKEKENPHIYNFEKGNIESFVKRTAVQFKYEEEIFNKILERYQKINLDEIFFMPIILDLYNQNRNLESIKNDPKLLISILNLKNAAENQMIYSNTLNWGSLISFIVRFNEFSLQSGIFPKTEIEKLFAKKQAYIKFLEVFRKFVDNQSRFENYAKNQLADWLKIEHLIKEFEKNKKKK